MINPSKKYNLLDIFTLSIFFISLTYIFYSYSLDYSPLVVIILIILYFKFFKKMEDSPSIIHLCLLGSIIVFVSFFMVKFLSLSVYFIPAVGFSILITLLFDNVNLAIFFSFFISSLAVSFLDGDLSIGLGLFSGSLIATKLSYRVYRRFDLIKAGILGGLVEAIVIILVKGNKIYLYSQYLKILQYSLLSSFFSSVLVIGLLPIFEFIFGALSNISLLELFDFNRPLVKRLIIEAPGTYQHSLVVANLSEAAANAIGANPLLARVGAYYHDIGKLSKPNYFIENLVGYKDVHKDLKPSLSKLIILNHVKEGIELAKKYHLHPKIIDFIAQHHGMSLVYFFYQKAKSQDSDLECMEEYRYPGPRPKTKEIVIVSLADAIEALSRTLEDPTPSKIEELVREVIRKRLIEGELSESNLTLKELEEIALAFIRILNAVFHARINYPKDEYRNFKSTEEKKIKH